MTPGEGTTLVVVTRSALPVALRLLHAWPAARLALPPRLEEAARAAGVDPVVWSRPLAEELAEGFHHQRQWVFFLAVGAVVRLLAPLLVSKFTDPAVVVLDGAGHYAIPLLSGHLGGANALAREIAARLGGEAVITTASDTQHTLAVDLLGQEEGWRVEADADTLRRTAACVVNGEPVAIVQEGGSPRWQVALDPWPPNLKLLERPDPSVHDAAALLWITRRSPEQVAALGFAGPVVLYRPPPTDDILLGIGCDRNTAEETIATGVNRALAAHGLAWGDVAGVASIDRKGDEPGLLALLQRQGWSLSLFTAEQLAGVAVPNPSATVQRWMGVPSVAEASALLAAGTGGELVMPKQIYQGKDGRHVTVAAARRRA